MPSEVPADSVKHGDVRRETRMTTYQEYKLSPTK